ncbi:hypothetical protein NDN08_007914 [Rhodosorus marinus]|uniref:Phospholipid scramblase n=1 Tax=Rhodosorus marinus TaxID=101924 RepID=A0AAV8V032_9RHOD|nr:hypothetical protein NDN08_007914 [Rhodosorus marinus]
MLRVFGVRSGGVGRVLRRFGSFSGSRIEYGRILSGFGASSKDFARRDGGLSGVEWLDSSKFGGARWRSSARPQPEPEKGSGEKEMAENATKELVKTAAGLTKIERRDLVLSPPALVVTREYEWGNILIGFEQANRYTIRAAPAGQVVGYIAEEDSLGKSLTRNFLRTHRPFKATILDSAGEPFFQVRRPFYMVSTSMYVETLEGETMGEIHMDWHLYRRRYNLYVDKEQFARVDSGFLAVDFDMRDDQDKKMASVNKDFTGFGREIFTDARQYVVRLKADYSGEDLSPDALVQENAKPDPNDIFSDSSKLTINQKATILACAISIDFDYFSIHSRTGGGLMGGGFPIFMPFPGPVGGGSVEGGEPTGDAGQVMGAETGAGAGAALGGAESAATGGGYGDYEQTPAGQGNDSQWATFEEGKSDFAEPEFAEPEFDDGFGDDDDGDGGSEKPAIGPDAEALLEGAKTTRFFARRPD